MGVCFLLFSPLQKLDLETDQVWGSMSYLSVNKISMFWVFQDSLCTAYFLHVRKINSLTNENFSTINNQFVFVLNSYLKDHSEYISFCFSCLLLSGDYNIYTSICSSFTVSLVNLTKRSETPIQEVSPSQHHYVLF